MVRTFGTDRAKTCLTAIIGPSGELWKAPT